jgi:hypothetical protein
VLVVDVALVIDGSEVGEYFELSTLLSLVVVQSEDGLVEVVYLVVQLLHYYPCLSN